MLGIFFSNTQERVSFIKHGWERIPKTTDYMILTKETTASRHPKHLDGLLVVYPQWHVHGILIPYEEPGPPPNPTLIACPPLDPLY